MNKTSSAASSPARPEDASDLPDLKDAMNRSSIQMTAKYAHIALDQGGTAWFAPRSAISENAGIR